MNGFNKFTLKFTKDEDDTECNSIKSLLKSIKTCKPKAILKPLDEMKQSSPIFSRILKKKFTKSTFAEEPEELEECKPVKIIRITSLFNSE